MLDPKVHRVRRADIDDLGFMVVSWTAEAVRSSTFNGMNKDLAFAMVRPHVQDHLTRLRDQTFIVCPRDDHEPIEAFAVVDGPVLMYLHVRGSFRQQGIATDLLRHVGLLPRHEPLVVATDSRDLRSIIRNGRHDIVIRTDLLPMGDRRAS